MKKEKKNYFITSLWYNMRLLNSLRLIKNSLLHMSQNRDRPPQESNY